MGLYTRGDKGGRSHTWNLHYLHGQYIREVECYFISLLTKVDEIPFYCRSIKVKTETKTKLEKELRFYAQGRQNYLLSRTGYMDTVWTVIIKFYVGVEHTCSIWEWHLFCPEGALSRSLIKESICMYMKKNSTKESRIVSWLST